MGTGSSQVCDGITYSTSEMSALELSVEDVKHVELKPRIVLLRG